MATKPKPKKTAPNKTSPKTLNENKTRIRKQAQYRSFRLSKRLKHTNPPLPGSFRLMAKALMRLHRHRTLFGGILLIYALLNVVLVRGLGSTTDLTEIKASIGGLVGGAYGSIGTALGLFSNLLSSSGNNTSDIVGTYQLFLVLIVSLALIWSLRQVQAGVRIRIRDAYYKGVYPLVLFLLVLCIIGLQSTPIVIGNTVYTLVVANDIAVTAIEKALWVALFGFFIILSIYMITSSIFALYIVTLPNMTPFKALRSARGLVLNRRWQVMRKVIALPLILLISALLIVVPIIMFVTPLAEGAFFIVSIVDLAIVHSYMYSLYRELL